MVFQYVPSTMSLSGLNGKGRGVWWRGGGGDGGRTDIGVVHSCMRRK